MIDFLDELLEMIGLVRMRRFDRAYELLTEAREREATLGRRLVKLEGRARAAIIDLGGKP